MNKTYRISNDGTIFEIKDDGSIGKLAKIDDNGRISTLSGEIMTTGSGSKGGYWFFIIVFAIAAVILGVLYIEADENYSRASRERYEYKEKYEEATTSMRSQVSSLEQERDNAKSELSSLKSRVSNTYPLIITDIEIANVTYDGDIQTNYGNTLYGSSTMYLKPRIKYIGLTSGDKTLKVNGIILMELFVEEDLRLLVFLNRSLYTSIMGIILIICLVGVILQKVIGEVAHTVLRYGMEIHV